MQVRELTTPLEDYSIIAPNATLAEAFAAFSNALSGKGRGEAETPRDFAFMVIDEHDVVMGRLVVWDLLQGLEPQSRRGVDALAMVDGLGAWRQPLRNLSDKANSVLVRDLVRPLSKEEHIQAEAPIEEALYRLIHLRALSLIVMDGNQASGILRVVDVFELVQRHLSNTDS